jgi:hypothetical protein
MRPGKNVQQLTGLADRCPGARFGEDSEDTPETAWREKRG